MRMMRKTLSVTLVLMLVAGVIFAAGSKETTSSLKPQKIRVLLWDSTFNSNILPNEIEAKFEAVYPDYDVEFEKVAYDSLDKQILLAHASGNDYDVIQVITTSLNPLYAGGVLAPMDSLLAKTNLDFSTWSPAAIAAGKIKGQVFGLPFDPDCRILAYNVNILNQIGLSAPQTTNDMLTIARTAYEKLGVYAMAGQISKNVFCMYDLGGFMLSFDAKVYDEVDGKYVAQLNTPQALEFLKWAVEMYKYMPKDTNINDTLARSMFAQGKVAMLWWTPSQIKSVIPQFPNRKDLEFSVMPMGPTGVRGSAMGGYHWGIGAGSKNKEAAMTFLEFVLQPENQALIARGLPADTNAFDYPPYNVSDYDMFREQLASSAYPAPLISVFTRIAETWNRRFQEALLGIVTPEAAVRLGQIEVQEILDGFNKDLK
ncbi:ABC-type glycerol-3-phosphate transport system, substrate-binding protein [Sphaerochaeta associata]|uniref:Sugar ABC transporter substrate-binding protein n=1 Tax=Sphaerochaeta associata TaxID=1129264 RepID=A0ABY4DAE2_9SPIR|nr:sugar ABC transporter substrate-binding protein [Sphaerochaeta associata]UOM51101.1 sugar ABC transporter substrate-binding protein [Sphaerochaeta associata]SMP56405.1 ABC-type glycerol-3-phosphate transport system, substrate-binding protein [Sphaerochaeta associata]